MKKLRGAISLDPEQLERLPACPSGADNQALRKRYRRALYQSILMLPPKEQLIVRLHDLKGLSCTAIAQLLQVHRSTVSRRLSCAHRKLHQMADFCEKSGFFEYSEQS